MNKNLKMSELNKIYDGFIDTIEECKKDMNKHGKKQDELHKRLMKIHDRLHQRHMKAWNEMNEEHRKKREEYEKYPI